MTHPRCRWHALTDHNYTLTDRAQRTRGPLSSFDESAGSAIRVRKKRRGRMRGHPAENPACRAALRKSRLGLAHMIHERVMESPEKRQIQSVQINSVFLLCDLCDSMVNYSGKTCSSPVFGLIDPGLIDVIVGRIQQRDVGEGCFLRQLPLAAPLVDVSESHEFRLNLV